MLLIFLSIITLAAISAFLVWYGEKDYGFLNMLCGGVGLLGIFASCIGALLYAVGLIFWIAAGYKVDIINREYGTTYSQAEIFYASDVIETVRQLDRKRYEVNGDIARNSER